MLVLQKNRLLVIPFLVGLALIIYSWWQSYPLTIDSVNDVAFNHVSVYYWIGLPVLLVSTFMMMLAFKHDALRCVLAVTLMLSVYSLSFYYSLFPGSDSHYFRGLEEYFLKTNDLSASVSQHHYFEFPSFFLLGKIFTSITGIALHSFEFLFYTVAGVLLAVSAYKYVTGSYRKSGFIAVTSYFILMFYFLNYQFAPFTLAFSMLFVALMLEASPLENRAKTLVVLTLFTGTVFTHAFVPMFFIVYEFVWYILDRRRRRLTLFLLMTAIYLLVQTSYASLTFVEDIGAIFHMPSEYAKIAEVTFTSATAPIDALAQLLSRSVVVVALALVAIGVILLLAKRNPHFRPIDKVVLSSGLIYTIVGLFVQVLGSRAVPLAFVPATLGAAYLFETRLRPYIAAVFLVMLALFMFLPLHSSFYDAQIMFQTSEAYDAENFVISNYDWVHPTLMLVHTRAVTYISAKQLGNVTFESDYSPLFPRPAFYDSILYTIGLGKSLLKYNYTLDGLLQQEQFNVVYDNGFSYLTVRSNLTRTP